jgi:hypothetical protein
MEKKDAEKEMTTEKLMKVVHSNRQIKEMDKLAQKVAVKTQKMV